MLGAKVEGTKGERQMAEQGRPLIEVLCDEDGCNKGKTMRTKRPSVKMSKQQLAEALAKALNLLNDAHHEFTDRQTNDFHEIVACLNGNEDVRRDFWNNGTLDSRDLI